MFMIGCEEVRTSGLLQTLLSGEMLCLERTNKALGLLGFTGSWENCNPAVSNMPSAAG